MAAKTPVTATCPHCGEVFTVVKGSPKSDNGVVFCSTACKRHTNRARRAAGEEIWAPPEPTKNARGIRVWTEAKPTRKPR